MILSIYLFVFNTGENIYQPKLFVYIIFFHVDILLSIEICKIISFANTKENVKKNSTFLFLVILKIISRGCK